MESFLHLTNKKKPKKKKKNKKTSRNWETRRTQGENEEIFIQNQENQQSSLKLKWSSLLFLFEMIPESSCFVFSFSPNDFSHYD